MIYKFTAKWCSSCLITNQVFQKLVIDYGKYNHILNYISVDIDSTDQKDRNLMQKFGIDNQSILPVIVFTDLKDEESQRLIGEQDYAQLIQAIDKDITLRNKSSPSQNFRTKKQSGFMSKLNSIFK